MKMLNRIFSFFNKGTIVQNNINISNTDLLPIMKNLKKDFFNGNIKKIEELNEYIAHYNSDKRNLYFLLLLKAEFLLQLFKFDEFEELLHHLEKNYERFLDSKFDELKLILFSFKGNKNEFKKLAYKLKIEKDIPEEYFEMIFNLNQNNLDRAKDNFEKIKDKKKFNILYIGFLIYSKLFEKYQDWKYYEKSNEIYDEMRNEKNFNFFEKFEIYSFYVLSKINLFLMQNDINKIKTNDELIQKYEEILKKIIEESRYFDSNFIKKIKNVYLYLLYYLNRKEDYVKLCEKFENELLLFHYLNYKRDFNVDKLIEIVKKNDFKDLNILVSLLFEKNLKNKDKIVEFLYENNFIKNDDFIIYALIKNNFSISENLQKYVKDNKNKNLYLLLSYIKIYGIENEEKYLIELLKKEKIYYGLLYDGIKNLLKIKFINDVIDVAIEKQYIFPNIINSTLELLQNCNYLTLKQFEDFVSNIQKFDDITYTLIGNIFIKFNKEKEAINFWLKLYEKNKNNISLLIALLQLFWNIYSKDNSFGKYTQQANEIYNNLLSVSDELEIEQLMFLLSYSLYITKETNQVLYFLNHKILNHYTEIKSDKKIISQLSSLYFTELNSDLFDLFLVPNNICFIKDKKVFVANDLDYDFINFPKKIEKILKTEKILFENDKSVKKFSLLHTIIAPIVFSDKNPNIKSISIDLNSDEPFIQLFEILDQQKEYEKALFEKYSRGDEIIGLFQLADYDYKNYFTLIPFLLENQNIYFNSLQPIEINKPKILTFSSILFLDELNLLDNVLKRDDIYIQKSLLSWLTIYYEQINYNFPKAFNYIFEEDIKFSFYSQEEILRYKKKILTLINKLNKCKIIEDSDESFDVPNAFKDLADLIGFQEYWALVYCRNHNYQIISENNIFNFLFKQFKFNPVFLSNSLTLILNDLSLNDLINLKKSKYKYLVNEYIERFLIHKSYFVDFQFNETEKFLIREANNYGFLERIKKYYYYNFEVLFPKNHLPQKTLFDKNIEKIIKIIKE